MTGLLWKCGGCNDQFRVEPQPADAAFHGCKRCGRRAWLTEGEVTTLQTLKVFPPMPRMAPEVTQPWLFKGKAS